MNASASQPSLLVSVYGSAVDENVKSSLGCSKYLRHLLLLSGEYFRESVLIDQMTTKFDLSESSREPSFWVRVYGSMAYGDSVREIDNNLESGNAEC